MQSNFSKLECVRKKKITRRDLFLAEIEAVTLSEGLVAPIEQFYPRGEGRGRQPSGIARMLRMYVAQLCFGLSDEGTEDAIYNSRTIRRFVDIDLRRQAAPDATTLLKFRRLLEAHGLTRQIFEVIHAHRAARGLLMREGTIVDATIIIAAPCSTKNSTDHRDLAMHQTKKRNAWHFGMKAHVGVDTNSGLVNTVTGTAANEHDISQAHELVHGEESDVFTDSDYRGVHKREKSKARHPNAVWLVAMMPEKRRALDEVIEHLALVDELERTKRRIRAKVEHVSHVVKYLFWHRKVCYRWLAKSTVQVQVLFGLWPI